MLARFAARDASTDRLRGPLISKKEDRYVFRSSSGGACGGGGEGGSALSILGTVSSGLRIGPTPDNLRGLGLALAARLSCSPWDTMLERREEGSPYSLSRPRDVERSLSRPAFFVGDTCRLALCPVVGRSGATSRGDG